MRVTIRLRTEVMLSAGCGVRRPLCSPSYLASWEQLSDSLDRDIKAKMLQVPAIPKVLRRSQHGACKGRDHLRPQPNGRRYQSVGPVVVLLLEASQRGPGRIRYVVHFLSREDGVIVIVQVIHPVCRSRAAQPPSDVTDEEPR